MGKRTAPSKTLDTIHTQADTETDNGLAVHCYTNTISAVLSSLPGLYTHSCLPNVKQRGWDHIIRINRLQIWTEIYGICNRKWLLCDGYVSYDIRPSFQGKFSVSGSSGFSLSHTRAHKHTLRGLCLKKRPCFFKQTLKNICFFTCTFTVFTLHDSHEKAIF